LKKIKSGVVNLFINTLKFSITIKVTLIVCNTYASVRKGPDTVPPKTTSIKILRRRKVRYAYNSSLPAFSLVDLTDFIRPSPLDLIAANTSSLSAVSFW